MWMRGVFLCLLAIGVGFTTTRAQAPTLPLPLTVSGTYMNQSNVGRQGMGRIEITVTQLTGDTVRDQFLETLTIRGDQALVAELQKASPVGRVRFDEGLGYDLRFARVLPGSDGTTRLGLATDRPVSFAEAVNRPRVSDYPITVIEVTFDADGKPSRGRLAVAIKAEFDGTRNTLTLENFADRWITLANLEGVRK